METSRKAETWKRGDMETWRHGHGHKKTYVIIIGTQKIGLNWHAPLWKITEIQKSIKLLISEFRWIPRNLIPSPTEVLKYRSKTIPAEFSTDRIPWTPYNRRENYRKRKNDKDLGFEKIFFILKLIFEFSRCLILKYRFFNLQIILQIRRFYAFLSTNI